MDTCDDEQMDQQYSSFQDYQHLNINLCLELIFPYLDVKSLASCADTCKQMKQVAEATFAQKYRKKLFYLYESKKMICYDYETDTNSIYIYEPNICFKVLRCFGQMISKLNLKCSRSTAKFWKHIDEYVAKYCVNNLTQFDVWRRDMTFENLQTTFPNVEEVRLIDCKLDGTISKFNERFPKMRTLELATSYYSSAQIDDRQCIEVHFPHLEHLSINISSLRANAIGFPEENVLNVLKLNPNIRSLNLCSTFGYLTRQFIHEISKICKSLDTLQITGYPLQFNGIVHFKTVNHLKIDHLYSSFWSPIPLTFDSLETFEWDSISALPRFLSDFIRLNPNCTKMKFSFASSKHTSDEIIAMREAFAIVKECEQIDVHVRGAISMEEIEIFLNSCKSRLKLTFDLSEPNFEELLTSIKSSKYTPWNIDEKSKTIIYLK